MPYFHIFGKFRELLMASEYVIFAGVGVMDCVLAPDVETIRDSDQLRSLARNVTANVFTSTMINTCRLHPPRDNVRRSVISHDQFCISQSITISDTVTRVSPLTGDCDGWISDGQECLVISQTNTPACQYISVSAMELALHCYCGLSGIRRH